MELKDMSLSPEEQAEEMGSIAADKPKYPWGLQITLNDDAIERLGLKSLPSPGGTVLLTARARITGVNAYETGDGDKEQSIQLQITELGLGPDVVPSDPSKLYDSGEEG